jgi:hypothetical protein
MNLDNIKFDKGSENFLRNMSDGPYNSHRQSLDHRFKHDTNLSVEECPECNKIKKKAEEVNKKAAYEHLINYLMDRYNPLLVDKVTDLKDWEIEKLRIKNERGVISDPEILMAAILKDKRDGKKYFFGVKTNSFKYRKPFQRRANHIFNFSIFEPIETKNFDFDNLDLDILSTPRAANEIIKDLTRKKFEDTLKAKKVSNVVKKL